MDLINIKEVMYREGEYLVGSELTGSHACYLLYGTLLAGESRVMKASAGHAEIWCLMNGTGTVADENGEQAIGRGQCFYYQDTALATITNTGTDTMVYVVAGGHTGESQHHHH